MSNFKANADSMTNAQGEFNPHKGRSEPLTTTGHQSGLKTSPADYAPEFSAQTLPPGSAPASNTFKPNPINEVPGQANNPDVLRGHGKEGVQTDALSTLPGATSAEVHTGYGHPGSGQTSNELKQASKYTAAQEDASSEAARGEGGIGLRGEEKSRDFEGLTRERGVGEHGPISGRQHNTSLDGAESMEPASAEEVASERR